MDKYNGKPASILLWWHSKPDQIQVNTPLGDQVYGSYHQLLPKNSYLRMTKEGSFIRILEAFTHDTLLASVVQRVDSPIH